MWHHPDPLQAWRGRGTCADLTAESNLPEGARGRQASRSIKCAGPTIKLSKKRGHYKRIFMLDHQGIQFLSREQHLQLKYNECCTTIFVHVLIYKIQFGGVKYRTQPTHV